MFYEESVSYFNLLEKIGEHTVYQWHDHDVYTYETTEYSSVDRHKRVPKQWYPY